ncbi:DUF2334 domain-containing protein [Paenibacillus aurantius]|uniref:DUF2334 domain-containing protein n=1 Tax=Paenibacillus aurantius TaxID=2918900 RepID=A0AA96LBI7_9BACL|nr:DUF2334 domain-containing protein [Paenibacillus aurantius]WNQ10133.1 DUF2334 domain-containing protein [Paenibacillus aurantius]
MGRRKKWARYLAAGLIVMLILSLHERLTVLGEQSDPKFVLLRLEDIGPGGQYESLEGLGKLRTVMEYLEERHIRFQVGVIPRWINYLPDGTVYNRQLDQQEDPYILAFNRILKKAEASGAVLGMHGYTHQTGDKRREDGHQESGIGNEFNVLGSPETATPEFARSRVEEGLKVMGAAQLHPDFWEAPHYHISADQEAVFRSYFGIVYENAFGAPGQSDALYRNRENTGYGSPSWGAVYVPTPFSYIPYNKDEKLIMNQLAKSSKLPSFFYHSFLEFKHLIPVMDDQGDPVYRDGLPEYRYPERDRTNLQKLITALRSKGYTFYSLHDYVPFTPANRVTLSTVKDGAVRTGDVTGDGQADAVVWDDRTGQVTVTEGRFRGMRNEAQPASDAWATISRRKGDQFLLHDDDGDRRQDLWVIRALGRLELYRSTGSAFRYAGAWSVNTGGEWAEAYPVKQRNGEWIAAGTSPEGNRLFGLSISSNGVRAMEPLKWKTNTLKGLAVRVNPDESESLWLSRGHSLSGVRIGCETGQYKWKTGKETVDLSSNEGSLRFGDFNGDKREDVLQWNEEENRYTVYLQDPDGRYRLLSAFGPWGRPNARLLIGDFDGSGTSDLGLLGGTSSSLDLALSYQRPSF